MRRPLLLGLTAFSVLTLLFWFSKAKRRSRRTLSANRQTQLDLSRDPTAQSPGGDSMAQASTQSDGDPSGHQAGHVAGETLASIKEEVLSNPDSAIQEHQPHSRSWCEDDDDHDDEVEAAENQADDEVTDRESRASQEPTAVMQCDSRQSCSADSGVGSPVDPVEDRAHAKVALLHLAADKPKAGPEDSLKFYPCSDSGQGSEADDATRFSYHFVVPSSICGTLIGRQGSSLETLKQMTKCDLSVLRPHEYKAACEYVCCFAEDSKFSRTFIKNLLHPADVPKEANEDQICIIEGNRASIDRCLDLIRERLPLATNPLLTLEQINLPSSVVSYCPPEPLFLSPSDLNPVVVSAVASAGHVFLQLRCQISFMALGRLEKCLNHLYNNQSTPGLDPAIQLQVGLVCVVNLNNNWYRAQVVQVPVTDQLSDCCDVKLLDYGGYYTVRLQDLRQIRSDFMQLPFQAVECYLDNVVPKDGHLWSVQACSYLEQIALQSMLLCSVTRYAADSVPLVHLFTVQLDGSVDKLLNRLLVEENLADWQDAYLTHVDQQSVVD